MQELAEFHFFILVVVSHVVVADQIHDSCCGNGCLELIRLGDEPFGELAAVAYAFDAHALAVDPKISPHCRANTVQHVLGFVSVLVAEDRIGESVRRRAGDELKAAPASSPEKTPVIFSPVCWT